MADQLKIGVLGTGAIGGYLGGHFIRAGLDTVLVGRAPLGGEIAANGLRVSDFTGTDFHLPPERVRYATETAALADRDLIFVTLKSAATAAAAADLAPVLAGAPQAVTVVSFQNGVRNAGTLRSALGGNPRATVLAGMVPYNVVWKDGPRFHCATSGDLVVEERGAPTAAVMSALKRSGLGAYAHPDLQAILWGKLLINLNNPINALAGVPIREELSQRAYRRIWAAAISEGLAVLRASGIAARRSGRMVPRLAPFILNLPDALFSRIAGGIINIDPQGRSSMWQDLQRGRQTEIDYINGEIVAQARERGRAAPINAAIVALIKEVEGRSEPPKPMPAAELARSLNYKL